MHKPRTSSRSNESLRQKNPRRSEDIPEPAENGPTKRQRLHPAPSAHEHHKWGTYRADRQNIIINHDRLFMRLSNECLGDQVQFSIEPNPAADGSKIMKLKATLVPTPATPTASGSIATAAHKEPSDEAPQFRRSSDDTNESCQRSPLQSDPERQQASGNVLEPHETPNEALDAPGEAEDTAIDAGSDEPSSERTSLALSADKSPNTFLQPTAKPLGLPCIGKTDYRTVCIQAIAHSRHMRRFLQELTGWNQEAQMPSREHMECLKHTRTNKGCMSCGLRKVVGDIWGANGQNPTTKGLNALFNSIQERYNRSSTGELTDPNDWRNSNDVHADVGEAIDWLLQTLKEEHNALSPGARDDTTFTCRVSQTVTCGNSDCGISKRIDQRSRLLRLNVYDTTSSLASIIDMAMNGEAIDRPSACPGGKCTEYNVHRRTGQIIVAPDVLFVELQVAKGQKRQHPNRVHYTTTFDLAPHMNGRKKGISYNLITVISYTEDKKGNKHYLAHARSAQGIFRLDDNWRSEKRVSAKHFTNATKLTDRNGIRTTLAMLVYERGEPIAEAIPGADESESSSVESVGPANNISATTTRSHSSKTQGKARKPAVEQAAVATS